MGRQGAKIWSSSERARQSCRGRRRRGGGDGGRDRRVRRRGRREGVNRRDAWAPGEFLAEIGRELRVGNSFTGRQVETESIQRVGKTGGPEEEISVAEDFNICIFSLRYDSASSINKESREAEADDSSDTL
ncbi:hypothetical protein HPP92_001350 [Vanilla planifolia]|uniref:Uncharacterized protein n=1 Tax=Vanilla planifolia TaxID=51239 RepID=A0A835VLG5_VANPL|nr:hypothetical protein HPP92_001350 [Vanilla planifolia]